VSEKTASEVRPVHPVMALLRETAWDIAIGLFWAALIVAIVLFSGVATQFAYVDF
jgi:hypothetical protein